MKSQMTIMAGSLLTALTVSAAVGGTGSASPTTTNTGTSTGTTMGTPPGTTTTPMPTTTDMSIPSTTTNPGMTMGAGAYTTSQLRDVQTALNRDVSAGLIVDGYMGPRTQDAIRRYQSANSLAVTGDLDAATIESLGLDFDATTDMNRAPASVPNSDTGTMPQQTTPVR